MILSIVILVLFALFWVAEMVAHLTVYRFGKTLSAMIWALEGQAKWGIPVRIVIAALCALLFTHLELHIP